ncbi:GDSL-type esterase/lipase family protein (plasmid) [Haladaptatus sp. SPP-AMP-3]|uniref:GDSL-type esterase/lipase family protein n=1 Tax=Haladaptatus sp. SPP-AMP-3 TaxID=3121295 RepID=UPI003C2BF0BA
MHSDTYPSVSLHNVAETIPADWASDGEQLCRVPSSVGNDLNIKARERVRHPTGCEVRFVPRRDDATVRVTLSAAESAIVRAFWGEFQPSEPVTVGPTPTTFEFAVPERLRKLDAAAERAGAFSPRICRLRFEAGAPVALHGVSGDCRPPTSDELPSGRYLAYGTSITEGTAASAVHLSYVARVARYLGLDALNLGCSGSAFCEPAMADYLAGRDDWDVATLSLSVNMANRGFTLAQFRDRAEALANEVAGAHPTRPVACVTLFPYHADVVRDDDARRAADFRAALRDVVAESPHDNLHVIDGDEAMDATGLTADALHPGDAGMEAIGRTVAGRLAELLD